MEMINFNKEFVERTKRIIEGIPKDYKYDTTLLLNCMLALVCLPIESTGNYDIDFQTACVKKLEELSVIVKSTDDNKTFRTIKNALSHMRIEPVNKNEKIHSIYLKDKEKRGSLEYHTVLRFSTAQLKEFSIFVADLHLDRFNHGQCYK